MPKRIIASQLALWTLIVPLSACSNNAKTVEAKAPSVVKTEPKVERVKKPKPAAGPEMPPFDEGYAFEQLKRFAEFGHRYYGAPKRAEAIEMLETELKRHTDAVFTQTFEATEQQTNVTYELTNIIGRFNKQAEVRILLGSHYDTRLWAEEDADPALRNNPIMGANDGTSGVAAILALLKAVSKSPAFADIGIDAVFFDGEEFGRPTISDYCKGSIYFANHIREVYPDKLPKAAVVLDMIAEKNVFLPREGTSNRDHSKWVNDLIWRVGKRVSPKTFSDKVGIPIFDDHAPLKRLGIPSVLMIDLDYPEWHTHRDTLDRVDAKSLDIVGTVLIESVFRIAKKRRPYRR